MGEGQSGNYTILAGALRKDILGADQKKDQENIALKLDKEHKYTAGIAFKHARRVNFSYSDCADFNKIENELRIFQLATKTHARLSQTIATAASEKITRKLNLRTFLQTCHEIKEFCTGLDQRITANIGKRVIPGLDCNFFGDGDLNHTLAIAIGRDVTDGTGPVFGLHAF